MRASTRAGAGGGGGGEGGGGAGARVYMLATICARACARARTCAHGPWVVPASPAAANLGRLPDWLVLRDLGGASPGGSWPVLNIQVITI